MQYKVKHLQLYGSNWAEVWFCASRNQVLVNAVVRIQGMAEFSLKFDLLLIFHHQLPESQTADIWPCSPLRRKRREVPPLSVIPMFSTRQDLYKCSIWDHVHGLNINWLEKLSPFVPEQFSSGVEYVNTVVFCQDSPLITLPMINIINNLDINNISLHTWHW